MLRLRHRRRRRSRLSWPLLGIEVAAIVLGVALGFFVNEWRQGRADRALGEAALRSIAAEMSGNCAQVRRVAPYHARMSAAIDSAAAIHGFGRVGRIPGFQGLNPPVLRTGSYDVALATGALAHVPFETADLASQIYSGQALLTRAVDSGFHALIQGAAGGEDALFASSAMSLILLGELTRDLSRAYGQLADSPFAERGFHCPPSE